MTTEPLVGRRILILHPAFFGFDVALASALRGLGAEVESWSTRPSNSVLAKALLRVVPSVAEPAIARTLQQRISSVEVDRFDTVIVVKTEGVSVAVLKLLRARLPNAAFNAYLFDSVRNHPRVLTKLHCFDRVLSFDPADCTERPGWIYRPSFAADCYWRIESRGAPSIYSLGSFHLERALVLSQFVRMSIEAGIDGAHDLLFRGWIDRMRSMSVRMGSQVRIIHTPVPADEAARRFSEHAVILDIHHPGQTGLTMRTFDALAAGRKLITTNAAVRDHEFFDPSRIHVIDRNMPEVDPGFLDPPSMEPPVVRLPERYSVRSWATDLAIR
jgi:hypothetical protein